MEIEDQPQVDRPFNILTSVAKNWCLQGAPYMAPRNFVMTYRFDSFFSRYFSDVLMTQNCPKFQYKSTMIRHNLLIYTNQNSYCRVTARNDIASVACKKFYQTSKVYVRHTRILKKNLKLSFYHNLVSIYIYRNAILILETETIH